MLAAGGGVCGVVLACWTNELLERSVPPLLGVFALQLDLSLDWRAVVFATVSRLRRRSCADCCRRGVRPSAAALVAFKGEIGGGRRAGGRSGWSRKW